MVQITAHDEQIVEYTDRIAAMEEELKKVRPRDDDDLFISRVTVNYINLRPGVSTSSWCLLSAGH